MFLLKRAFLFGFLFSPSLLQICESLSKLESKIIRVPLWTRIRFFYRVIVRKVSGQRVLMFLSHFRDGPPRHHWQTMRIHLANVSWDRYFAAFFTAAQRRERFGSQKLEGQRESIL